MRLISDRTQENSNFKHNYKSFLQGKGNCFSKIRREKIVPDARDYRDFIYNKIRLRKELLHTCTYRVHSLVSLMRTVYICRYTRVYLCTICVFRRTRATGIPCNPSGLLVSESKHHWEIIR